MRAARASAQSPSPTLPDCTCSQLGVRCQVWCSWGANAATASCWSCHSARFRRAPTSRRCTSARSLTRRWWTASRPSRTPWCLRTPQVRIRVTELPCKKQRHSVGMEPSDSRGWIRHGITINGACSRAAEHSHSHLLLRSVRRESAAAVLWVRTDRFSPHRAHRCGAPADGHRRGHHHGVVDVAMNSLSVYRHILSGSHTLAAGSCS